MYITFTHYKSGTKIIHKKNIPYFSITLPNAPFVEDYKASDKPIVLHRKKYIKMSQAHANILQQSSLPGKPVT